MLAIINNVLQNTTKTGKPYVVFDLYTEKRQKINAKLWDTEKNDLPLKNHDVIEVDLHEEEYNGKPSYIVTSYKAVNNVDRKIFLPSISEEKKTMYTEMLDNIIATHVTVKKYSDLLSAFFADYREKYLIWPASKVMHGAYLGGLLEHSVRVCNFAMSLA